MNKYWYNYVTQDHDALGSSPTTDEQAVKYVPQIEAAQAIYRLRRELGDDVIHAMLYTLTACVEPKGKNEND